MESYTAPPASHGVVDGVLYNPTLPPPLAAPGAYEPGRAYPPPAGFSASPASAAAPTTMPQATGIQQAVQLAPGTFYASPPGKGTSGQFPNVEMATPATVAAIPFGRPQHDAMVYLCVAVPPGTGKENPLKLVLYRFLTSTTMITEDTQEWRNGTVRPWVDDDFKVMMMMMFGPLAPAPAFACCSPPRRRTRCIRGCLPTPSSRLRAWFPRASRRRRRSSPCSSSRRSTSTG